MLKLLTALLTTLGIINSSFAQDHAKLVPPNAAAFRPRSTSPIFGIPNRSSRFKVGWLALRLIRRAELFPTSALIMRTSAG